MITIGRIPAKSKGFFRTVLRQFGAPAKRHFCGLVLAWTIATSATVLQLARRLRNSTHRTKHGEFFWRSRWNESSVLQTLALDTLKRLHRKDAGPVYFILDETHTFKRARKMDGIRSIYDPSSRRHGFGHTIVKACLWYRGVIIPWGSWVSLKPEAARRLRVRSGKRTELVAWAIREAPLPKEWKVVVLFDAFYLCRVVTDACRARKWHYVSMGKGNRRLWIGGQMFRLGRYGRNVLRRSGQWMNVEGPRRWQLHRLAERMGWMKKLGERQVKVVFSRRKGDWNSVALVTDDVQMPMRQVVTAYLRRWAIEQLIKDEKQQLGLGEYRLRRYRAVLRHLHLVDIAYACLTHAALEELRAQGLTGRKHKMLRLPPVSERKAQMRQTLWREMVEDVIKNSREKSVIRRLERLLAA
jgi:hypothetical protein